MSPGVADHVQQVNRFWTHQLDRGPETLFDFPEDKACLDDTEQLANINQLDLRGRWWFSNAPATARTWSGNPAIVLYVARTNPRTARHSTSSTKRMAEMMTTQPPWCVEFESAAGLEGTLAIVLTALTQADALANRSRDQQSLIKGNLKRHSAVPVPHKIGKPQAIFGLGSLR
ncbi:hypothetical protein LTR17_026058 [Elasticomyces elasticus]|nr:hypothetical protein LTR17_026058 [Elasticomyces elasticus]